jgi:glucose/arabinose dehydrogenase
MINKINLFLVFTISVTTIFCNPKDASDGAVQQGDIKLPPGFKIEVFAENVSGARSLSLSPNGVLFVGSRGQGNVYAVLDRNKDNKADEVIRIASGLDSPNGVAFRNGSLYTLPRTAEYFASMI